MSSSSSSSECALADCTVEVAKLRCSSCKMVNYCSAGHQRSDWRNHKNVCSPLTLQSSPELGQYYVASRDLKARTLLVSEFPLLVEPIALDLGVGEEFSKCLQFQELLNSTSLDRSVICLSCCKSSDGRKCPKCDWPICSIECSKAKIHAGNECPIFVKYSLKSDRIDCDILLGVVIFSFRAMLIKKSQPQLWSKIMDLQFESSNRTFDQKFKALGFIALSIDSKFRTKFQKLEKDYGEDFLETRELSKLLGIQLLNAFSYFSSFEHGDKPYKNTAARNLYLKASKFSHACFPNCFWWTSSGPDFKIEIRTALDIAKGQVLSIAYVNAGFVLGSVEHSINELKSGAFNCFCERCVDPTELNSMISAVKCKIADCQDGYLLPKDPKNVSPSSIWECLKCGDKSHDTWKGVKHLTERALKMIKKFQGFEPKKIEDFLILLRKHLHPNHWVIQQFCLTAIRELGIKSVYGNFEEDVLDYYIGIMNYLLQVFHLTMPGLNYFKSEHQCELFIALDIKFRRMKRVDEKMKLAKDMKDLFEEIGKIKEFDPRYRTNNGDWKPIMLDMIARRMELESFLK